MTAALPQYEKEHYEIIEKIYDGVGKQRFDGLDARIEVMLQAWDTATGERFHIPQMLDNYVRDMSTGNVDAAKRLYCLISPFLFFIGALREIARSSNRNAVTQCGMFCERVVRNILQELPSDKGGNMYLEMRDNSNFDGRAGRVKSELERRHYSSTEKLYNSLKNIYYVRNGCGPHDVPPPEPIQARICITESLPVYMDYLGALNTVGVTISQQDFDKCVNLFYALTEMKPSLIVGEETEQPDVETMIIELYRQGFFSQGRQLSDVVTKLRELRYNYPKPTIANALSRLSSGKNCVLSRRKTPQGYVYAEKIPPSEAFKSTF